MIALVLGVIALIIDDTSLFKELTLISTYTGTAPLSKIAVGTAKHVNAEIITSSPLPKPAILRAADIAPLPVVNE
jgi:hypothetical protein